MIIFHPSKVQSGLTVAAVCRNRPNTWQNYWIYREVIIWMLSVSGQTISTEKGTLTVLVGGNASAFEQATLVITAFAGLIEYVEESGSVLR